MTFKGDPRTSTQAWKTLAASIRARDLNICYLCRGVATEVDHVTPRAEGGTDDPANLRAICVPCHRHKSAAEGARAAAAAEKNRPKLARPPERHPGLLP